LIQFVENPNRVERTPMKKMVGANSEIKICSCEIQ
jgi:hypothetical protein